MNVFCHVIGRLIFVFSLAACSSVPSVGPDSEAFSGETSGPQHEYIDISADNVKAIIESSRLAEQPIVPSIFRKKPSTDLIRQGDILNISIWEPDPSGVFGPDANKSGGVLREIAVDLDGSVLIPYAGKVKVSGYTVSQAAGQIVNALKNKVSQPQVIVSLKQTATKTISVFGDVAIPGVLEVPPTGMNLAEVIARSGGAKAGYFDSIISIKRKNEVLSGRLNVISTEADAIFLKPGDVVHIKKAIRVFQALGAFRRPGEIPLDSQVTTLLSAISKAEGISNATGDASYIFLIRKRHLDESAHDPTSFDIYRFNFKNPSHLLWSGMINVQDGDAIYAPEAQAVPLARVLALIGGGVGIGAGAAGITR